MMFLTLLFNTGNYDIGNNFIINNARFKLL